MIAFAPGGRQSLATRRTMRRPVPYRFKIGQVREECIREPTRSHEMRERTGAFERSYDWHCVH
jgi:hypothetical protein